MKAPTMKILRLFIQEEWKVMAYGAVAVLYCLAQPSMAAAFAAGFWGGAVVALLAARHRR
jgi:hypothetical protein